MLAVTTEITSSGGSGIIPPNASLKKIATGSGTLLRYRTYGTHPVRKGTSHAPPIVFLAFQIVCLPYCLFASWRVHGHGR